MARKWEGLGTSRRTGLVLRFRENKDLLDGGLHRPGDVHRQLQGGVVLCLLQPHDGLPPHPHPGGQLLLGQALPLPVQLQITGKIRHALFIPLLDLVVVVIAVEQVLAEEQRQGDRQGQQDQHRDEGVLQAAQEGPPSQDDQGEEDDGEGHTHSGQLGPDGVLPEPLVHEGVGELSLVEEAKEPTAENEQPEVQQTQSAEEKTVEPLVPVAEIAAPEPKTNTEQVKREIIFAEGSYELDDVAKEKIDAIIASFDDAKANKIAIMAYNYDNGEDVFRKKRQSLNRAIEIRSYLLNKGHKNFSIKVINITDDAAQGNVVEIDELK